MKDFLRRASLEAKLHELDAALTANDVPLIQTLLKLLVEVYQPEEAVVDLVHLAKQN